MVSKNQIKRITGLQHKKFRHAEGLFFAEGAKVISELLQSDFELDHLYETDLLFTEVEPTKKTRTDEGSLKKISALSTPNNCLAIFKIPEPKPIVEKGLIVALDDVRDPGNLGTIVRLCDWFGITELVCSHETVDIYNPKVVQATMGSIARVNCHYFNLETFLANAKRPVFGTFMEGKNIYNENLPTEGIIVLGNEANGISSSIEKSIARKIAIPRFGNIRQTESLNVATAAAIVLSEFRRSSGM